MLDILYNIIIFPVFALLEILFNVIYKFLNQDILTTIAFVSFIVNLAALPLYIRAENMQKTESELSEKIKKTQKKIKMYASGDEKLMLLQTLYRQNNYHPVMHLRSNLSLILQIPLFLTAYIFFSNLPYLKNAVIFDRVNLSLPDGLLEICGFNINVLPVIMTIINLVAGFIYAKNSKKRDKILFLVLGIAFFIILYNSPSGLVLYWIYNNIFSLLKNIFFKPENSDKNKEDKLIFGSGTLYFLSAICLCLFTGFALPTCVIASSPVEFSFIYEENPPHVLVFDAIIKAAGIFIFWGGLIYYLLNNKWKNILSIFSIFFLFVAVFDFLTIKFTGTVSSSMQFDIPLIFSHVLKYNLNKYVYFGGYYFAYLIIFFCLVTVIFKVRGKNYILKTILTAFMLVFFTIGIWNSFKINETYIDVKNKIHNQQIDYSSIYNLSKEKNVIVIMLDKGISSYLPLIFDERKELKRIFTGFIYYPNTVSFGPNSISAYPALVGGYDYTPFASQMRSGEKCQKKHDEAMMFLPLIFKNNGWNVTVTDAPVGHYQYITPGEMFIEKGIDYKNILVNSTGDIYANEYLNKKNTLYFSLIKRNLLYFSFLRILPPNFSEFLYKNGSYHNLFIKGLKINQRVINFYSQLFYLPKFTKFNSKKPVLVIMYTALTHEPRILTPPDYELLSKRKNKRTTEQYNKTKNLFLSLNTNSFAHYNVNAAAFILVGKFLNYLKENNAYDNSRIIIVSDHGSRTGKINNPVKNIDFAIGNNPLLFVKDFNAKGEFKISDRFMTNADVVEIALDKVVNNPKNPYTNKPVAKFDKTKGAWVVTDTCYEWSHIQLNRTKPIKDEYKVSHFKGGDISKKENWSNEIKYGEIKKIFENAPSY